MKRVFRITIILIPVVVISAGIGLWRHHYLKIMNAEPEKVFNNKTEQPNSTLTDATKVILGESGVNTGVTKEEPSITAQHIDNSITPEETGNLRNSPADTVFGDIIEENLPTEAVAALKKYKEIQPAQAALNDELKPLLNTSPLDWDAIGLISEKMDKLHQQRKDALEILAKYSDEALNELQATLEREKAAERMVDSLDDPTSAEKKVTEKENTAKLKRTLDEVDDLHKSIQDMSRKELEEASEKLEDLSEELPKSDE